MDDAGGAAGPNVAAQAAAAGWWAWAGYSPGPGSGPGGSSVSSDSVGMDYGGPSLAEKWDLTMFAIISAVGLVIGYLEASGIFNAPYSKFRRERLANWGYVSTRWGMLAIDGVALLIVLLFYLLYAGDEPYHTVTFFIYTVICVKRILEILFLHRYSGPVTVSCVVYLLALRAALTASACASILFTHQDDDNNWVSLLLPVPLVAFGLIGNHYHHILLAQLRSNGKVHPQRPYRVPRGGMFFQAACPHYLMELLVWLGFSVVVHRATMYGILIYTSCQLVGRAVQTRRWYVANVRGFPPDRTCLVPFLL
ncbi:hypothetical protein HK405_005497 [Cladochytrium tenue]|nr:hypothetical protein HK405_005497 [Cladochytrium tenue]